MSIRAGANPTLKKVLPTFLFVCIIAAIGLTIYIISNPPPGDRFTEFYVLGPSGKATGYPTNLTIGEIETLILGAVNYEYEEIKYNIIVRLENTSIAIINNIILEHEGKWECNYTFMPERAGEMMKLEFHLYKNGFNEIYRSLHLWITVRVRKEMV